MLHTIEIIGETMGLMDEDGNVDEAVTLTGYRAAQRQIQIWTNRYALDVAAADRLLFDHFMARRISAAN